MISTAAPHWRGRFASAEGVAAAALMVKQFAKIQEKLWYRFTSF
jgi:hypothetical protein